ncbi:ATP-binding protein [Microbulbifer rhizosphaerae]|uniref:histidine kinase n=1 Tax=Microbulbifer rhizosphaerae TaxID=1562603 RepID=A0A7W4ZA29_9GAMM|nr:ATP-binding protein [Microbulbifer rhizosphaerae]MBB3060835.1 two-component system sensor histidine kinase BaeS [Microbulbifer rhizosphaerae]
MLKKISHKLMATIIGVTLIAAAAIYASGYFAVRSGLAGITEQLHRRHLDSFAGRVGSLYEIHRGWDALLADDRWLRSLFPGQPREAYRFAGPPERRRGRRPPPFPNIRLLDADERVLNPGGPFPPELQFPMVPVRAHGEVVGYLGFPAGRELRRTVEAGFTGAALWTMVAGALVATLLALAAALLLARRLLKPVHHLSEKVHNLAGGDFSQRARIYGEDEIAVLAEDVNFLANALQQNQQARQRWISDIAHELRTPLTVLSAEVESAQYGIQGSSDDMLESMGEEIHQLNTLINDLRTLTQSDLGGLSFQRERIPVRRFFEDYAHKAKSKLVPHGLSLEPDIELDEKLSLFADKGRLKQLLDNLLQNSRRYTDAGGKVQLSLHQDERELVLCWQDSAPGVPAESLPKLFERLYRVEGSRNRATGGSGLGLSICKSIVEAQNGVIEAGHSKLGGLAITCRLPLMT